MTQVQDDDLLTVDEGVSVLKVSTKTILRRKGRIPGTKVGGRGLFCEVHLMELLARETSR